MAIGGIGSYETLVGGQESLLLGGANLSVSTGTPGVVSGISQSSSVSGPAAVTRGRTPFTSTASDSLTSRRPVALLPVDTAVLEPVDLEAPLPPPSPSFFSGGADTDLTALGEMYN